MWRTALRELVFPSTCVMCLEPFDAHQSSPALCNACDAEFTKDAHFRCDLCGGRLGGIAGSSPTVGSTSTRACLHCRGKRRQFEHVVCLGSYEEELRYAVLRMKLPTETPLALAMGKLLARRLAEDPWLADFRPDLITPIPMHWSRRLVRGTNSAEVLAEAVAGKLNIELCRGLLVRGRNTAPQFDLPPKDRFRNVRGAFRVKAGYDLADARLLIVDDILTTGATAHDAARAAKTCGAAHVAVAVVGRAETLARV